VRVRATRRDYVDSTVDVAELVCRAIIGQFCFGCRIESVVVTAGVDVCGGSYEFSTTGMSINIFASIRGINHR